MRKIRFTVLGKRWILRSLNKKDYKKKNGSDSLAMTWIHKRRIDVSPFGRDKETLIHELTHAYFKELCLKAADPDPEALEEIFCEIMSTHGKRLLALADRIHAQLIKLHRRKAPGNV